MHPYLSFLLLFFALPLVPLLCTHLFHMDYAKPEPHRSSGG